MRAWQDEALRTWSGNDHRAVVEAVRGTGKTVLGIAAVAEALAHGHRVVVVVPDAARLEHWIATTRTTLPGRAVGGLGGSTESLPTRGEVLVVTAKAAAQLRPDTESARASALVVDEIQDYAAGAYPKLLLDHYEWRLGLATTAERHDDIIETVVHPYFGAVINGCDHPRAVREAILPRVRVLRVAVRLGERETQRLQHIDERMARATDTLVGTYGAPESSRREFDAYARLLADATGPSARIAARYLDAVMDRDAILADCEQKMLLVRQLPVRALARTRTVLFAGRASSAGQVVQALTESGMRAARVGAGVSASERDEIVRRLRDGDLSAIVESRVLDQAVAIPDLRVGVVLATTRTERQLAHRLGRIMRPDATSPPILLIAHLPGTSENPRDEAGAQDAYLASIAEEVSTADLAEMAAVLERWLADSNRPDTRDRATPDPTAPPTAAPPTPARSAPARPTPALLANSRSTLTPPSAATAEQPLSPEFSSPKFSTPQVSPARDTGIVAEFCGALTDRGGIGTAEELGDIIGLTDQTGLAAAVEAAAAAARLHFYSLDTDFEDLLLLSVSTGGTPNERDRASRLVAEWINAADPLAGLHGLMSDIRPVRVPARRLVQIAAFVRGVTPTALL
nr:helicase-related protein [Nocardia bovistercoris]